MDERPDRALRVLVVDDDHRFRRFTTIALEAAGMTFEVADDGQAGLDLLESGGPGHFDVILLDVQMPRASGWDLLHGLRERSDEVPVIFVTAVDGTDQRVRALRNGADDYVTKPVEFDELIARLEAVVRRRNALPELHFAGLRLDLARRRVLRAGERIELSPREYDLLLALVNGKGALVTREQLLAEVWDLDFDPGTNVVDVHIGRLRKKLNRVGPNLIDTVRGEGYRVLESGDR